MAELVAREQTGVVVYPMVEIADRVYGPGLRRPDAEDRAVGDQIGPHRGAGMDVVERSGHGQVSVGQRSDTFVLNDRPILKTKNGDFVFLDDCDEN